MAFLNLFKTPRKKEGIKLKQVNPIDLLFEDINAESKTYYSFVQDVNTTATAEIKKKGLLSDEECHRIWKVRDDAYWNFRSSAGFASRDDAVKRLKEDRIQTLERALKNKRGNIRVIFVKVGLHIEDINKNAIYTDQIEVNLQGGMKAEEIKKKYEEAVKLVDKEWIKSGKLKQLNDELKEKRAIEEKEAEEYRKQKDQQRQNLEEEIKNEKLDVTDHELYFKDFEEGKLHDWMTIEERAITWGKLLQIEKRKNGHYTQKIVRDTFSKAYGGDSWEIVRDLGVAANALACFWKDLPDVMATLPIDWFGSESSKEFYLENVRSRYDEHTNESYKYFREDTLAKIRARDREEAEEKRQQKLNYYKTLETLEINPSTDILALKEKIMKREIGDKVGKTADVATGKVSDEHSKRSEEQVTISKALIKAKRAKEGKE